MSEEKGKGGKFLLGAALGAVAGAIAGIVMAPKSGEETRKDIKNAGDKAIQDSKEGAGKFLSRFKKDGNIEEKVGDIKENVEKKVEEAKETVEKIAEKKKVEPKKTSEKK